MKLRPKQHAKGSKTQLYDLYIAKTIRLQVANDFKKLTPSRENLSSESDNKKQKNKSFFGLEKSREELNFKIDATNN